MTYIGQHGIDNFTAYTSRTRSVLFFHLGEDDSALLTLVVIDVDLETKRK